MNNISSKNRKYIYLILIVLLFIPVMLLGMPATQESEGGTLASLRKKYDLGESAIGQIDPSSSTMNFLLLGMRGIATNQLWLQAEHYKNTKNWASMRSTVESIIMLQPHYAKVWEFQGWNLAYNVSSEWDAVEDRYYWVKEGAKFYQRGSARNKNVPDLVWWVGNIHSKKIGRSDEWKFFRKFYLSDPDVEQFDSGPDPDLNPEEKDNYLVARDWFEKANLIDDEYPQQMMTQVIFRHYPIRAMLDYADALQREGKFGDRSLKAWEDSYNELTQNFGRERFQTPFGEIFLEGDRDSEAVTALASEFDIEEEIVRQWILKYQVLCNYSYWRARSSIESEHSTMVAHRELYDGQELYKKGRLRQARKKLVEGFLKFDDTFSKIFQRDPSLNYDNVDEHLAEEIVLAILYFNSTYVLTGQNPPEKFPLKVVWDKRLDVRQNAIEEFHYQNVVD